MVNSKKKLCRPVSTDRISAEIAQLGERQTEDLKVPRSNPGFQQYSSLWLDQYSQNLHSYMNKNE